MMFAGARIPSVPVLTFALSLKLTSLAKRIAERSAKRTRLSMSLQ